MFLRASIFLTCFAVAIHASHALAQRRAEDLPLYYDFRNGNITIDTTEVVGGVLTGYGLAIPFDGYRVANYTPFMETFFVDSLPDQLGESNLSGISPGVYSLGNVLPDNLSPEEFDQYFGPTNVPQVNPPFQYYAFGAPGSAAYHVFEPVYGSSPFAAINDATVGPPAIDRWAVDVSLIYNSATGALTIDSTGEGGGTMWSYSVLLAEELFDVEAFLPITDGLTAIAPFRITEVGLSGIPEGMYTLGPILPSGLSETDLTNVINRAVFIGEPDHGAGALDLELSGLEMSLSHVIPEPNGLLLGVMAILPLFLRREI